MSAYLHDIGMTPEFKKVDAHYRYLLTGGRPNLTQADVIGFKPGSTTRATRLFRLSRTRCH